MNNIKDQVSKLKVDALYGKKKHFNAADRKNNLHYWIGIPSIVINILTSSILLYVLTDSVNNWLKYVPLVFALVASILSGLLTFLNLQKKVEGHRRVGNKYLAVMKKCKRFQAYINDNEISSDCLISEIESIASEINIINIEAESFPTNNNDYELARKGIELGEKNYTETELNL